MITSKIGKLSLHNCIYNASGVNCITYEDLHNLGENPYIGVIQSKSCTLESRIGNPLPRYYATDIYSINSSGLPNIGYECYDQIAMELVSYKKPYIISVSGLTFDDNIKIVNKINENTFVSGIELNLSCPNIMGKPQTGYNFEKMDELLRKIFEHGEKSVIFGLKLPPYFDICHFVTASEIINQYPIDFITCINSIGNGLVIDPDTDAVAIKPKNGFGGIGGSSIKPTALANVRKMYELTDCDIIGCGGVCNGRDVYEHILCGAKAVQIGTQFMREGSSVFARITKELSDLILSKGYTTLDDFRGGLGLNTVEICE